MKILCLYNATQTYTNTVYEHVDALRKYSRNQVDYCHLDQCQKKFPDPHGYGAVIVHYSIRLPYDQIPEVAVRSLSHYSGLKVLFVQDEYEHTHRTWHWIKTIGFQLVFTVAPEKSIAKVYPPGEFPTARFVSNLTGYVPESLPEVEELIPPSRRDLVIGYRGRPLHLKYGALGREKIKIGQMTRDYCLEHGISHDIAWREEDRIYGPKWYEFMASCRATLGSESGSNVFDWDNRLEAAIDNYRYHHPGAGEDEVYQNVIRPLEVDGLMNQVSPRVFEAIALRTVLVLFEGEYSGVVEPDRHYIPLDKQGRNFSDVFAKLENADYVDEMAERAYQEVIESGKYSYKQFVNMVDREIEAAASMLENLDSNIVSKSVVHGAEITREPIRANHYANSIHTGSRFKVVCMRIVINIKNAVTYPRRWFVTVCLRIVYKVWVLCPKPLKSVIRKAVKRL